MATSRVTGPRYSSLVALVGPVVTAEDPMAQNSGPVLPTSRISARAQGQVAGLTYHVVARQVDIALPTKNKTFGRAG
jgi:hypothetical protein